MIDFRQHEPDYLEQSLDLSDYNVRAFANEMYQELNHGTLDDLHPEDQQFYIEYAQAALQAMSKRLIGDDPSLS